MSHRTGRRGSPASIWRPAEAGTTPAQGPDDPDAGQVLRAGPVVARLAGVAGAEEGGEATRHCGDHEDRPCLKGDIYYPAASGQGIRDRR
jgi:hypothetical protein